MNQSTRNWTHFPENDPPGWDRWPNVAEGADGQFWAAVRGERQGRSRIFVLHAEEAGSDLRVVREAGGAEFPQRPSLVVGADGDVHLAWNTFTGDEWRVMHAVLRNGDADAELHEEAVWRSSGLCLPPSIVEAQSRLWLAWPTADGKYTRIVLSGQLEDGSWDSGVISPEGCHASRPVLAGGSEGLLVAWDSYHDRQYEIVYREAGGNGSLQQPCVLSHEQRNWLGPTAASGADGTYYLAFQEVTEIHDPELGIAEHAVGVVGGKLQDGQFAWLPGRADGAPHWLADLRPGLVAAEDEPYEGYDGVRRRPQLGANEKGEVWLCWESRERRGAKRDGRLLACPLTGDSASSAPITLHEGGVCYAVPPSFRGPSIPAAYVPKEAELGADLASARFDLGEATSEPIPVQAWRRWEPSGPQTTHRELPAVETTDGPLELYWLDLHCHSNQSPDAEGEPDELLHYGRDFAGLDGMAIVDNDYYPNKTLADSEWRVQQDLAQMFTEPGRFVVFPAYEYTYHSPNLTPNFNHRYVLYPGPGGRLLRRIDAESDTAEKLMAELANEEALPVAHHCTWRPTGHMRENVEVCSSWRVCIEETDFIHKRLAAGDRFGFVASSDSHRACPGMGGALTGVLASELTPAALFDGLRRGRTIATQGERIFVDFRAADLLVGEEGPASAPVALSLKVIAPRPIEFLEIIRDGRVVHRLESPDQELARTFDDSDCGEGSHYYFVRVKLTGDPSFNAPGQPRDFYRPFAMDGKYPSNLANARGPYVWTSPIWVDVRPS